MEIAYAEEFVGTSAIRTIHTIREHVVLRAHRVRERDGNRERERRRETEHPQARACEFCSECDLLLVFIVFLAVLRLVSSSVRIYTSASYWLLELLEMRKKREGI